MMTLSRKAWGDITAYPARFLLFLGVTFAGTILLIAALIGRSIISREIDRSFENANPPHVVVYADAVTDDLVSKVKSLPNVEAAEPRHTIRGRVLTASGWQSLRMIVMPDASAAEVSKITLESGQQPGPGELLVERSSLPILGPSAIGDVVDTRFPARLSSQFHIAGITADGAAAPGWQDRIVYAYASAQSFADGNMPGGYDELHILANPSVDVPELAKSIETALTESGTNISRIETPARVHPHLDQMRAVLMLITAFAIFGLAVAAALAAILVMASMVRELRLIGVMKAMGASNARIAIIYTLPFALTALAASALAMHPGMWAGRAFARFVGHELNLVNPDMAASPLPVFIACLVGAMIPAVTAYTIARRTVRLTVREALQGHSDPKSAVTITQAKMANSPVNAMSFRNLSRSPLRLAFTLIALALGGTALMTAGHSYESLIAAVDRSFSFRSDDVDVRLLQPMPGTTLEATVAKLPGVQRVEAWGSMVVNLKRGDGTVSARIGLLAPPLATELLRWQVSQGRWIVSDMAAEAVVTRNLIAKEAELALGRDISLTALGRTVTVKVVGVIEEVSEPGLYVSPAVFDSLAGQAGLAGALRIVGDATSDGFMTRLDDALFAIGAIPVLVLSSDDFKQSASDHFVILLFILGGAAAAALTMAGFGLAATTAITVTERSREIGVMRAMGAADRKIATLFLRESLTAAAGAAQIAILLALPLSWVIGKILGNHGLYVTIPFSISSLSIAIWVIAAGLIALAAALIPVRLANRRPARDMLAYE
jgi:putative ABC transport system permease protein